MNSDARERAEVASLNIKSGRRPGRRSLRLTLVTVLHKKVTHQQRRADLPESHLQPKKDEVNPPLFFSTSVTAVPQIDSVLETSGCSLGILFLCVSSQDSSYV